MYGYQLMAAKYNDEPLTEAINKADVYILRAVLQAMCKRSEECRKEASLHLLVPMTGDKRKAEKGPEEEANKKPKTVVSRFEPCVTCKEVFDIEDNDNEACQTHYGEQPHAILRAFRQGTKPR